MTDRYLAPGCSHRELAAGWVLHALEPAEEILVTAHLPDCSECTRTVAETELVGVVLGLSIHQASPSAELEQRVLALTTTAPATLGMPLALATRNATGRSPRTRAAPRQRSRGPRRSREPLCVPETLVLIAIALLVFTCTFAVVLYAVP